MIDTHCHIDDSAFASDREAVISRQREAGVTAMIVPGVNAASVESVLDVCRLHPGYCYPALGLHPEDVKADYQSALSVVEEAIRAHRDSLVAIGEIGLDYYWDTTYRSEQQSVLRSQLLLARELDLPVILHNREATEDILRIVREVASLPGEYPLRGVFHCFNGSRETAQQILGLGFYLGIGGVITFKNCRLADTLRELCNQQSPICNLQSPISNVQCAERALSRFLLETDAPYMAPVPHRGERNESRFMLHVAERLAEACGTTPDEIIRRTTDNAKLLFRL